MQYTRWMMFCNRGFLFYFVFFVNDSIQYDINENKREYQSESFQLVKSY